MTSSLFSEAMDLPKGSFSFQYPYLTKENLVVGSIQMRAIISSYGVREIIINSQKKPLPTSQLIKE